MGKVLTIIVPSYNAEKYLKKALDSFIKDTVNDLLDVIVVNDGSIDSTGQIAQEYERRYPGVFRLVNKENGGHGSAINAAVQLAEGKYIKVIDADDWIVTENLQKLISILCDTQADAIVAPFDLIDMGTGKKKPVVYKDVENRLYTLKEVLDLVPRLYKCMTFHGLIYKTEAYKKALFSLSEKIFYEDHEYATIPFAVVKTVLPLDFSVYQYLVGNAEQSVAYHNQVKRIGHIEQVIKSIILYEKTADIRDEAVKRYFSMKISDVVNSYYAVALVKMRQKRSGRQLASKMQNFLKSNAPDIVRSTNKKYSVMLCMNYLRVSPRIYQNLVDTPFYQTIRKLWKVS